MLRKRQELERLQRAGKFKYEYDSDEETDGGTWEHRLRLQEMEATQRWAEELTKKAEGKHHIGDFLPPDELERFLEKVMVSSLWVHNRKRRQDSANGWMCQ
jgi:splicing factor 4